MRRGVKERGEIDPSRTPKGGIVQIACPIPAWSGLALTLEGNVILTPTKVGGRICFVADARGKKIRLIESMNREWNDLSVIVG